MISNEDDVDLVVDECADEVGIKEMTQEVDCGELSVHFMCGNMAPSTLKAIEQVRNL